MFARYRRTGGTGCGTGSVALAVLLAAAPATAQTARPPAAEVGARATPMVAAAHRLEPAGADALRLDGVLDEAAWAEAPVLTGFRQREPQEGAPASEETEVRVLYDAGTLYIGVLARDREPGAVIARILQRDRLLEPSFPEGVAFAGDDAVAILLDVSHDHRNAVLLATNPNGAEFDALVTDEGRAVNIAWRGIWRVAARRSAEGWSAEFAIPFRTARVTSSDGVFGFNVSRMIRRRNEESLLAAWRRGTEGLLRVSRAVDLAGIGQTARGGLGLDLKPWVLGRGAIDRSDAGIREASQGAKIGADVKYDLAPGLVLDGTVNTDFAQAEADDEQVNLTRFSLFVPEKREFFLENAGIFEFGLREAGGPPLFSPFFSRRIGLADDGPVPIRVGARLTGRTGRQTIGLLDVTTAPAFDQPRTNFAVARLKRDLGQSGYVGALLADRRWSGGANTVGGVDVSAWPSRTLNVQGFAARTATTGPGGDDGAYAVSAVYRTGRAQVTARHVVIGSDVDAQLGFVRRSDIRRTNAFGWYTFRPRALSLRAVTLGGGAEYITRTDHEIQDRNAGAFTRVNWNSGEILELVHERVSHRLDEGFDLADSIPVPAGDYANRLSYVYFSTSSARAISGQAWVVALQRFYGGRMTTASAELNVAAGSHVALSAGYTRNAVRLPAGSLDADIARARVTLAFTTRLVVNALLQYNGLARRAAANVRLHWMYRPGSDIFLVLNEERGSDASTWAFRGRGINLKVTYLSRL